MRTLKALLFLARTTALGIVLIAFAPALVLAWACYFICREESQGSPEHSENSERILAIAQLA